MYFQGPAGTVGQINAATATGTVSSAAVIFTQDMLALQSVSVHVTVNAGNTVIFETSNDNSTWFSCAMMPGGDLASIIATTTTTTGSYTSQINSRYFRARVSNYVTGSITATGYFKSFGNSPNSIGGYVSSQLLDGTGNAITSATAGSQRPLDVSLRNASGTLLDPTKSVGRVSANAPVQNLYTTTNITTAAYVQLIASTTSATNFIDIFDSSGQAMILATGGVGSEVIQAYVPPGGDQISLIIAAGTRVSYKALSANATSGYLLLNLYT